MVVWQLMALLKEMPQDLEVRLYDTGFYSFSPIEVVDKAKVIKNPSGFLKKDENGVDIVYISAEELVEEF